MTLDDILSQWENECSIGDDLDAESRRIPKLHSKYISLLSKTRLSVRQKDDELNELVLMKWRWYEGNLTKQEIDDLGWSHDPFKGKVVTKTKYDMYMEADPDLQRAKQVLAYVKEKQMTLEEIVKALNWRHTHIKNIIDNKRFESGY